jgi:hypothetical protein
MLHYPPISEHAVLRNNLTCLLYVHFTSKKQILMRVTVVGDVAPSSVVEIGRRFRGAYCLCHLLEAVGISETSGSTGLLHGATSQKAVILILSAART